MFIGSIRLLFKQFCDAQELFLVFGVEISCDVAVKQCLMVSKLVPVQRRLRCLESVSEGMQVIADFTHWFIAFVCWLVCLGLVFIV